MHWLDRWTEGIAPRWTLRRIRARMAGELLQRHYEAAAAGRRTSGWTRSGGDANAATGPALSLLRQHARDLVRNNAYAESALATIADHAVGWGITAKPARAEPARLRTRALEVWKAWAETAACDADGRQDFFGLQKLIMRTVVESGEVLVRRRIRRPEDGLPIPLQLQVLEPDYLDPIRDGFLLPNGGRIIQGIEFDAIGRRAAYWLFREHPGAAAIGSRGFGASDRIPSSEILHVFSQKRPGQVRGVSWFAPITLRLKDFDAYEDAALMKQKIAACLAVITSDVDGSAPPLGASDAQDPQVDSLEPGMILNVPPGRSIGVVQPPRVDEHDKYAQTQLRAIATGLGVTYEDLTGDYCIAPDTRVLRGDLRWVRADELWEGDPIVAFDEERPNGRGQRRKWRTASIVRAGRRDLPRVRVVTDKAIVTVSNEHMFLCIGGQGLRWSPKIGYGHVWVRADALQPGDKIAFLAAPWQEGTSHNHGYLQGIADGEGYVAKRAAHIGISQKPGEVLDEIGKSLRELGFAPRLDKANGGGVVKAWEILGVAQCLRFLGEIRPTRLLEKARNVYEGIAMSGGMGKRGCQTHALVQSMESVGVGPVVTLSTTTHTVITEGLCSHNTEMPFSAARMSRLRHWARVDNWRWQMLIPQFCNPVWRWAMEMAVIGGLEGMPRAEWSAPPMPMIEPDKEGLAYQRNVRSGIMSLSEAIRERGYDPDDLLGELAEDFRKLDRLGLILDSDPRKTTQAGNPRSAAGQNDSQEPVPALAGSNNGRE